jgi:hypothetical protein
VYFIHVHVLSLSSSENFSTFFLKTEVICFLETDVFVPEMLVNFYPECSYCRFFRNLCPEDGGGSFPPKR